MNEKNNIISCKEYYLKEKERIKEYIEKNNIEIQLSIIQVGDNYASNIYVKNKIKDCNDVGIKTVLHKLPENISLYKFALVINNESKKNLYFDEEAIKRTIIVQLPLPKHLYVDKNWLYPWQDVDGLLYDRYSPCTAKGIIDWLDYNHIDLCGKHVVIIGRGELTGKPLAKMMIDKNATVTLCHSKTPRSDIQTLCSLADIVVVAVGKPKWFNFELFDTDCFRGTPLIIDVGINRDENNKLCGDVDRKYETEKGCYVTPVPNGVGLLTRIALLKNIIE